MQPSKTYSKVNDKQKPLATNKEDATYYIVIDRDIDSQRNVVEEI